MTVKFWIIWDKSFIYSEKLLANLRNVFIIDINWDHTVSYPLKISSGETEKNICLKLKTPQNKRRCCQKIRNKKGLL